MQRFGSCVCAVLAWCSASVAVVPAELSLQARGACPSADAIARQLNPLLPLTLVRFDRKQSSAVAEIWDTGDGFAIRVAGAERAIAEPVRDCMERARVSAVFIALALDPPLPITDATDGTKREGPVPSTAQAPVAEPSGLEPTVSVSAGLVTSVALGRVGSRRWGVGPSLGVALGREAWELALSGAVLTPFELEFGTQESVRRRLIVWQDEVRVFDTGQRPTAPSSFVSFGVGVAAWRVSPVPASIWLDDVSVHAVE